jgi:hypothetical protein
MLIIRVTDEAAARLEDRCGEVLAAASAPI